MGFVTLIQPIGLTTYLFGTNDPEKLTQEQKDTITSIITLGAAGIAYGATDDVSSAVSASEVGKVGVEWNYLGIAEQINFKKEYFEKCKDLSSSACQDILTKWKVLSYGNLRADYNAVQIQAWEKSVSDFYAPFYKDCNQKCKKVLDYQKYHTMIAFAGNDVDASRYANGFVQGYFGDKYTVTKSISQYFISALAGTASLGRTVGRGDNTYGKHNQNTNSANQQNSNISYGSQDDYQKAKSRIAEYRKVLKLKEDDGNFGYLEGVINGRPVNNRMWRSTSLDRAKREPHIFSSIEVIGSNGRIWDRMTDSEYRMLNNLAHQMRAKKGEVYPNVTGQLKVVSENPFCISCNGVIKEFSTMFPNVKLILIDGAKK